MGRPPARSVGDAGLGPVDPRPHLRIRLRAGLLLRRQRPTLARRDEVDRAVGAPSRHAIPIGSGDPEIDATIATEVAPIGDESRATHDAAGDFTTLQWRNGDILGEIRASGGLDFADVEEFALALDALLPDD
jgi:hypothetical protein